MAVIKGYEGYNVLKVSCSKLFITINSLQKAGKLDIKGKDVLVEFYLGRDYKVILATINNWSRSLKSIFGTLKYNNLTIYFIIIYIKTVLYFTFSLVPSIGTGNERSYI